jgi:hypothetical protein
MANILRRGDVDSDDEYSDTEEAPQIQPTAPAIQEQPININVGKSKRIPKPKAIKAEPKIPKVHVCQHCGEQFARNTSLTKHINELRCPIKRRKTLDKELQLLEKEKQLRELESEISNKILKSQEKVKKPRKTRVAKPKAPPNSPVQPVQQKAQPVYKPVKKGPTVNF